MQLLSQTHHNNWPQRMLSALPGYPCLLLRSSPTAQRGQKQNVEHRQQIFVARLRLSTL